MKDYEFFIYEKGAGLKILMSSEKDGRKSSLYELFSPRQTEGIMRLAYNSRCIIPCAEEGKSVALFSAEYSMIGLAVRFDSFDLRLPEADARLGGIPIGRDDSVLLRICSMMDVTEHIGRVFGSFPKDALLEASMLLNEYVRTRIVITERERSSFGFALASDERMIASVLFSMIAIRYALRDDTELFIDLSDCGRIMRIELNLERAILNEAVTVMQLSCGEECMVIRRNGELITLDIVAAIRDESRLGLKVDVE